MKRANRLLRSFFTLPPERKRADLRVIFLAALISALFVVSGKAGESTASSYNSLLEGFKKPDHAVWGEVPLWWWEGEKLTKRRLTWELETLASQGVKAVCPIQRSPGRCDPPSFSERWWELFRYVERECRRLGMRLWAYDQIGYGNYGWLEKAAAKVRDTGTFRVVFLSSQAEPGKTVRVEIPAGRLLVARAYPLKGGQARDEGSVDLAGFIKDGVLAWTPRTGRWRTAVAVAIPYRFFHLSKAAAEAFLDMFYGRLERTLGAEAMGKSFAGVFQDEHPPTPRDIWTEELERVFRSRFGYPLGRAIPALHFDLGPLTPKYRTDFFDAYLAVDEKCYWKRVYDWTRSRGLLTSYDNWGRCNIYGQSRAYIDYFRTQRWFSAPGNDDWGGRPIEGRNYYDTKLSSSIANLYKRPRVWVEAFHSSGWGRTTDQTLTWLSAQFLFGANLYDEHGLYYTTRASTWEHAAPDPHFRQPYWRYYHVISDWVSRMSFVMSQGFHVADAAVHYPVVSLLAGEAPGAKAPDYNLYMKLSRVLFDSGIDNDIADDDSIMRGKVENGALRMGENGYRALVFGPETTMRRAVLQKALQLAEKGGVVVFFGRFPEATTDGGRGDPKLSYFRKRFFGVAAAEELKKRAIKRLFPGGGVAAFLPADPSGIVRLISDHVKRDFVPQGGKVWVNHRRVGDIDIYCIQSLEKEPFRFKGRFRVDGVPERWDPFTGGIEPVERFERRGGFTFVEEELRGNTACLFVFRPGEQTEGGRGTHRGEALRRELTGGWRFSVIPTRDNRWGDFRWPPSNEVIGPEVRAFKYQEERGADGVALGWQRADFDDSSWETVRYSIGPYWLFVGPVPKEARIPESLRRQTSGIEAGKRVVLGGKKLKWRPVSFSKTIGLARPTPWGGHSGYPDGGIDENFIDLPAGRKLLFTRLRSPSARRLGLRVELGNRKARLWVNGVEQPFEDAVGNLPLREGSNSVLLEISDGGKGRLFVQKKPPSITSLEETAKGIVRPNLARGSWIWFGNTNACYLRKTFRLKEKPVQARVVVTADNGYRLFINGVKVGEEIGPWARWEFPETFNVTELLQEGENVITAWVQDLGAQEGFIAVLTWRDSEGREHSIATDGTWKGTVKEETGWERPGFDSSSWRPVKVFGPMGVQPWRDIPLRNVGIATQVRRRLSIHRPSPYLDCFNEVPDLVYDVKPQKDPRVGWFRFRAPPGLKKFKLPTQARVEAWVNGVPVRVANGEAVVESPPSGVSVVALRLHMSPGAYGGAAFRLPVALQIEGGIIGTGEWSKYALPTYSGIGVYKRKISLSAEEARRRAILDLGKVLVAAEVFVNGKRAGVRLARPFTFDLTGLVREGSNTLEVRVANTIAPHYTVTNRVANLGPTASGLIGPVVLEFRPRE